MSTQSMETINNTEIGWNDLYKLNLKRNAWYKLEDEWPCSAGGRASCENPAIYLFQGETRALAYCEDHYQRTTVGKTPLMKKTARPPRKRAAAQGDTGPLPETAEAPAAATGTEG